MGCGSSTISPAKESNAQKTMKAALLIQMWYRRYLARLEARRRYTWNIFQSLEYAGEQDQLRLYNFFNDMISQLQLSAEVGEGNQQNNLLSLLRVPARPNTEGKNESDEDVNLQEMTDPSKVLVPSGYKGPRLDYPLKTNHVQCLIDAFKRRQVLHAHYLLELLHETRRTLKMNSNVNYVHTQVCQQVTVVGDLHGKLDDLLIIFYKNGLPEARNPYVFNGDFVDRGPNSVEIAVLLFACLLVNPLAVYINRGNHEDHVMNLRYGFIKEIMTKYKGHATKVIRLFGDVFSWLPMATVIDEKILVCHGGISDRTDLDYLKTIDRHKYISILRPPTSHCDGYYSDDSNDADITEWQQVLDLLWSDPRPIRGCSMNTYRGGGSYFGPDVTKAFLDKHGLQLLIRSHECKPDGYEFDHNDQVLTVFSASNYYEVGSNKGAYVKLGPNLKPRIVQYMATKQAGRKLTIKQRVSYVEASALRSLREKLYASKSVLLEEFQKHDVNKTGLITVSDWSQVMTSVFQMELPWRSIASKLVTFNEDGLIKYISTLDEYKLESKYDEVRLINDDSPVTETLYRNKENLEMIFRAIDTDNSGYISMEEFEEACILLSKHLNSPVSKEHITQMARNIDLNKDGRIDFNEFLEAFRIVDKFGRELQSKRQSQDITSESNEGSPGIISPEYVNWSPQKSKEEL